MSERVGVIGLGIMGSAMSNKLISSGFEVHGYDTDPAAIERFKGGGGMACTSASEVAQNTEQILLSLPSATALASVSAEIAASGCTARVLVETSTLALAAKNAAHNALADSDIALLDCPLSGTGAQARVGDIAVYASGPHDAYLAVEHIFPSFSRSHVYLGAFGNGSRMKYIANLLVAVHNVAAGEAIALAARAGLDLNTVYETINKGAGSSRIFELRGPMMVADVYTPPTMKVDMFQKDLEIIDEFARSVGASTPLLDAVRPIYDAAQDLGYGTSDTAAVRKIFD